MINMNLIIDIGNTRTKFALFNNDEMAISVPVDNFSPEHVEILLNEHTSLDKVIVSSTGNLSSDLNDYLEGQFKNFIDFDSETRLPFENCYQSKDTLGRDRLAAIAGANFLYPDSNILVIDAGTAITYDFINDKNQYLGGNISPGLNLRFKALKKFTAKLPLVEAKEENKLYGDTTETAIRCGVQNGTIFEVESTIEAFKQYYKNLRIIITGGDAKFFDKKLKKFFLCKFQFSSDRFKPDIKLQCGKQLEYFGWPRWCYSRLLYLHNLVTTQLLPIQGMD